MLTRFRGGWLGNVVFVGIFPDEKCKNSLRTGQAFYIFPNFYFI